MGQLNCQSQGCRQAARLREHIVNIAAASEEVPPCIVAGPPCDSRGCDTPGGGQTSSRKRGVNIWVQSAHDLIYSLPYELDADLDHLHVPPSGEDHGAIPDTGHGPTMPCQRPDSITNLGASFESPDFARDVGVCCESADTGTCAEASSPNQDNYACVQVDDPANPWGLYAVADGHGPQGHLLSALLVHELPALLALNPCIHRNASLALHQSFLAVGEMVSSCDFVDASASGGTLSAAMLSHGLLHVAWVGDSKVILGRLDPGCKAGQQIGVPFAVGSATAGKSAMPLRLRAVELTSDHTLTSACAHGHKLYGTTDAADNAGGPAALPAAAALAGKALAGTLDRGPDRGRGLTRSFGNPESGGIWKNGAGGADIGGGGCEPEVRRMRLKPEDLFVILGTSGLWNYLSPDDAVAVVSQGLHLMAADAARTLQREALRRAQARTPPGYIAGHYSNQQDITAVVVYLAGARYVSDFSIHRADHVPEHLRHVAVVRNLQPRDCPIGLWCGGSNGPVLAGGC